MEAHIPVRHLTSSADISSHDLATLFALTDSIKRAPHQFSSVLSQRVIATFFCEPSTRTRLSFEAAIARLGGSCISVADGATSSTTKGETLEDTIRTIMGYVDAIILRHPDNESAERAAEVSNVPIICAGAGSAHHPTQTLLDLYTIQEAKGRLDDLSIVIAGDLTYGRTARSLIELLAQYGNNRFTFVTPSACALHPESRRVLDARGATYREASSLDQVLPDADVVYMTRVQKERFSDTSAYAQARGSYTFTRQHLDILPEDAIILHPLPRNEEIEVAVDTDPRALYFIQAHNGLYVRMALLTQIIAS